MSIYRALIRFSSIEMRLKTVQLFKTILLLWLLLGCLLTFPYRMQIYSDAAFIPALAADASFALGRLFLLEYFKGQQIYFFYAQIAAIALGISGFAPRISLPIVALFTSNVWNKAWVTLDGGNNLASLLLLYMCLMNTTGKPFEPKNRFLRFLQPLAVGAHNLGYSLCVIQVVIVYFSAGLLKAEGSLWQNGMALYYILQTKTYSTPNLAKFVVQHPLFSVLGCYTTMLFQWTFPTLVWVRKTRPYLLTVGCCIHLGIAVFMGLFLFGLIMMVSYILFFEEETSERILRGWQKMMGWIYYENLLLRQ